MKTALSLLLLFVTYISIGQTVPSGQYTGYERILPYLDIDGNIVYYGFDSKKKEDWFHQVTITVTDSLVTIQKVPVFFKKGKKTVSSGEGGYYFYHGLLTKTDSGWTTNLLMDSCISCEPKYQAFLPLSNHLIVATKIHDSALKQPPFEHLIVFDPLAALTREYFLKPVDKGLLIYTHLQHNILFKKTD